MVKPQLRRWGERVLLAVGVGLAVYMISRFPLSAIADACLDLGWGVSVAPLIALCWMSASSRALQQLVGGGIAWRLLLWNRIVGEGYNALLPAAGVGGEPVKLALLARHVPTQRAVVALLNDRLIENAIALMFTACFIAAGALVIDVTPGVRTAMLTYGAGATVVGLSMFVVIFTNLTGRIGGRIARWLGATSLADVRLPVRVLLRASSWLLLARICGFFEIALYFALLGLPVTAWNVAFVAAALAGAGFVGGVIPQGIGVDEAATVGIFEMLHFPGPAGIAFALARRGRMLLMSVAGIALHVTFGHRVAGDRTDT